MDKSICCKCGKYLGVTTIIKCTECILRDRIKQLEEQKSEQYSENWRRYEYAKELEAKIKQLKEAKKQVFVYLEKRYLISSTMEEIETLYNSILEDK